MWKRQRIERAIAAELYGEADEKERQLLAKAREKSPELQRETERYAKLVAGIPTGGDPELPFDLVPEVRRRLTLESTEPERAPRAGWRMAVFSAASLGLVVVFGLVMNNAMTPAGDGVPVADSASESALSPLGEALALADAAVVEGDFTTAYQTVEAALAENPEAAQAAEAQLFLADLAFEELNWFDRAEDAYRDYRQAFTTDYTMSSPELRNRVAFRLDLLAETRDNNYDSLHALVAARRQGRAGIAEMEQLLAKSQGVYLPAMVTREMAYAINPEARENGEALVQAMEDVRQACSLSGAVARLDYEIGTASAEVLENPAKAREHLTLAAESGDRAVAERARAYLARLEAEAP